MWEHTTTYPGTTQHYSRAKLDSGEIKTTPLLFKKIVYCQRDKCTMGNLQQQNI